MSSAVQLPLQQTLTLNERQGCYYIQSVSTGTPLYTVDALSTDCASCGGGGTAVSWEVESCTTVGLFKYVVLDQAQLSPGNVVDDQSGDCWTVIQQSTTPDNMDYGTVFVDCPTCEAPPTYKYIFESCDGTFNDAIISPVQLSIGSIIDITPGPGCGEITATTNVTGTVTYTSSLLYEDCNACNGITPPSQTCHEITNSGLATAQGTYIYNGLGYGWTVNGGNQISICAEQTSVSVTSGAASIYDTLNVCTSPKQCTLPPPQGPVYTIEDCETSTLWTMETLGSQFQVGDVIQYYRNTGGTGARYCGEIIVSAATTLNASLANPFVSYVCGDAVHCLQ